MQVKNVIIINDYDYSQGGASKVAIDNANMLQKNGINCIFFSPVHKITDDIDKNIRIVSTHQNESLKSAPRIKGVVQELNNHKVNKELLDLLGKFSNKDTIVHIHGWTKAASSSVFRVCRKKDFKVVLTLHEYFTICPNGSLYNYKKCCYCNKKPFSLKCKIENCDSRSMAFKIFRDIRMGVYNKDIDKSKICAIFISDFQRRIFKKCSKVSFKKEVVIPNFVPYYKSSKTVKIYDFVYVGRTSYEKGISLYLNLAKKMPDSKFLLVGKMDDCECKNLTVTGWVSEQEVTQYIQQSKCMVLPSLWPETFGLNAVTALKNGMPCLASYNTALEDYIVDGKNGFLFKQGDFNDLYDKAQMIKDGALTNPDRGKEFYTETEYINQIISLYNEELLSCNG